GREAMLKQAQGGVIAVLCIAKLSRRVGKLLAALVQGDFLSFYPGADVRNFSVGVFNQLALMIDLCGELR
ncbi:MAG: hypothetical protein AAB281_05410, partial [Actinomycetota bacterium]